MGTVNLSKPTVNLSKGGVINLSKHTEGLQKVTVGLGWKEGEANTSYKSTTRTVTKKAGFFARLFGSQDRVETVTETVGLSNQTMDLDAWAIRVLDTNKVKTNEDLVAYFNKDTTDHSIHHHGDDLTGGKAGDCEQIDINLVVIPSEYKKIILGVTIYNAEGKNQTFAKVRDAFIRIFDTYSGNEICRYDAEISKDYPDSTSFIFGELVRNKDNEWEFNAIGNGQRAGKIIDCLKSYLK